MCVVPDNSTEWDVSVSVAEHSLQLIFRASEAESSATHILRMTQADIAKALGLSKVEANLRVGIVEGRGAFKGRDCRR